MNPTPIGDNIIQLNRWRFVNAFLVREDDGFTLVDTTTMLVVGHGGPVRAPAAELDKAIARAGG